MTDKPREWTDEYMDDHGLLHHSYYHARECRLRCYGPPLCIPVKVTVREILPPKPEEVWLHRSQDVLMANGEYAWQPWRICIFPGHFTSDKCREEQHKLFREVIEK